MKTFNMVRNLLNTFISNNYLSSYKMDLQIVKTQTNIGKESLIVDGYAFRRDSILKYGEISWHCFLNRQKYKAKIRIDADSTRILSGTLDHNHPVRDRSFGKEPGKKPGETESYGRYFVQTSKSNYK